MTNMFGMAAIGFVAIYFFAFSFTTAFLVIYIINVVKKNNVEQMIGAKLFVSLLLSLSFHMILIGISVLLITLFGDKTIEVDAWKMALGLITGSVFVAIFPLFIYQNKIPKGTSRVIRQVAGFNAIITGLTFSFAITIFFVMLYTGAGWRTINPTIALIIVYFIGMILTSRLFIKNQDKISVTTDQSTFNTSD
ncbi:MAG: hypothetical protein OEV44_12150 [Spirochaetota bacterium]|nr:hypothetical protein [Spirochaetota bacterium]